MFCSLLNTIIVGEIPEEIGVLQELKELDFRRNKISGNNST